MRRTGGGRPQLGTEVHSAWHDRHAGRHTIDTITHSTGVFPFSPLCTLTGWPGRSWASDAFLCIRFSEGPSIAENRSVCYDFRRESLIFSISVCTKWEGWFLLHRNIWRHRHVRMSFWSFQHSSKIAGVESSVRPCCQATFNDISISLCSANYVLKYELLLKSVSNSLLLFYSLCRYQQI